MTDLRGDATKAVQTTIERLQKAAVAIGSGGPKGLRLAQEFLALGQDSLTEADSYVREFLYAKEGTERILAKATLLGAREITEGMWRRLPKPVRRSLTAVVRKQIVVGRESERVLRFLVDQGRIWEAEELADTIQAHPLRQQRAARRAS